MIQHVVFFKFKPGTSDDQIDAIADGLSALPESIEDIRSFVFGRDVIRSERSYDFGLVSTFDDLEALDRYQVHPEHQKVVTLVKAVAESVVAVDFEM